MRDLEREAELSRWMPLGVLVGAALVAFGAAGWSGRAPRLSGEILATGGSQVTGSNARTVGVGGCASAGCHGGSAVESLGGILNDRTWNGSAAHWLAADPHTQAYEALNSKLAAVIMARFAPGTHATSEVRCLACHTNPSLAGHDASPREVLLRADGVSCEACHGDAGRWMPKHTTWTTSTRAAGCDATGMTKLFLLEERASVCAGCHVGAPAGAQRGYPVRDMNHDMIAAGHPRLNFDFADSQRRLSPHWLEEDRSPEFEVKSWFAGRTACADAAVVLKDDRAKRGKEGTAPAPEFADFSCVSCHHKLGDGFPSTSAKPVEPVIWPADLKRGGSDPVAFLDSSLAVVNIAKLDADAAGLVYFGLAARERFRMKRENRSNYDPAFDRLRVVLSQPRGNIDFRVKPEALIELKALLKSR